MSTDSWHHPQFHLIWFGPVLSLSARWYANSLSDWSLTDKTLCLFRLSTHTHTRTHAHTHTHTHTHSHMLTHTELDLSESCFSTKTNGHILHGGTKSSTANWISSLMHFDPLILHWPGSESLLANKFLSNKYGGGGAQQVWLSLLR